MRVLISGYYGMGNAGDEALLAGLLGALGAAGHRATVLSGTPRATSRLHGVAAAHRLRGLPAALLRSDAVISGGGGLLQDRTSARSLRYYLTVMELARLLGRGLVVYGQSIGPLSERGASLVRRALRGVPVAVRDRPSQELLASLGIEAALVADGALLLEPPPPQAQAGSGPVLLIPRGGQRHLSEALARLGSLLAAQGQACALLAMHPAEDEAELAWLSARLPGARPSRAADHREALRAVAASRFVVSVRLHGLILAALADRPYAGLVYDPKVSGFLAESGAPAFAAPVDVEALLGMVAAATAAPGGSRSALLERARRGAAWLDAALRGLEPASA